MEYRVRTTKVQEFIEITGLIQEEVKKSGAKEGIVVVFVP
ncbi:MAG TPA: YjbQ family protein, partial [Clostridia bacterium]|nr:YjbQ family protein [Clostridia bacterium]